MLKWILAALAFLGLNRGSSTPAKPNNSGHDPAQAPSQQPGSLSCPDGDG